MSIHSEILEQPARLAELLSNRRAQTGQIAAAIRQRDIRFIFLAARGTSDNAGRYANYLWGARNQLPMALATPSLFTYYQQPPRLKGALVVGISQSGQSPDVVSVLAEGKRQGCLTLAITNSPESPLAQTADLVLDIMAGKEAAVAATKTYTAELMAVAMLSTALLEDKSAWQEMQSVPAWARQVLEQDKTIASMVQRYRYMQRCVVLGRGFNYATAFEWSLKLKEMTYVAAEPYSPADFLHGPIAMVEHGFPVLAVAPEGKVFPAMIEALELIASERGGELVIISNSHQALNLAQSPILLPAGIPEWLTPLIAVIPGQLFSYHLTCAKGYDPESPRSLHKVTQTH
jgi:glucosamine--fructose-6-phosphate aminotransferase (isomerizing)